MCDFMIADSVPADSVVASIHPQAVRIDLLVTAGDGSLSLAHVMIEPIAAMRLAYQINEAHIVALQTPKEES